MPNNKTAFIEGKNISKSFGGVHALSDASIEIYQGEVHALLGENGSGKSTLMKILSGQIRKDNGDVKINGKTQEFSNPQDAINVGISMVAQEISLVPDLTVAENIMLGRQKKSKFRLINWQKTQSEAKSVLDMLGVDIDLNKKIADLQIDLQQIVEIARSIATGAKMIILDEPTSSLTIEQSQRLFQVVRRLANGGKSFVLISHKINEILDNCDNVTILRDGFTVGRHSVNKINAQELVSLMVGREIGDFYYKEKVPIGSKMMEVKSLSVPSYVDNVSFEAHKGEIVGLYGLESAGHKELLEACFGLKKLNSGSISIDGKELKTVSPRESISNRIAYVPADRKRHGGVLELSIAENLRMVNNSFKPRWGVESWKNKHNKSVPIYEKMLVKSDGTKALLGSLSGGNQQKVVFGKWLEINPKVFLLDDPTRGIDIPAKTEIYRLIADLVRDGATIVIISTDLPELLSLADRVLVMFQGKLMKEIKGQTTEEEVMYYATGNDK